VKSARTTDNARRLQERSERLAEAWRAAAQPLANTEAWLRDGKPSGVLLEDYDGPEPALLKGEKGLLDAIENRRRRVREIKATIHTIQSSCFPRDYCKERARGRVERRVRAPDVSLLIEHDGDIVWPMLSVQSEVFNAQRGAVAFAEVPDVLGLYLWRNKEAMLAALDELIDEEADDAGSLSHEERQRREAEAQADLLDIERQEAHWVWEAQKQNLPVEHRAHISPVALLGLQLVTAPRAAPPPTSPEHGYNIVGGRR
jgi:hypothetical protein